MSSRMDSRIGMFVCAVALLLASNSAAATAPRTFVSGAGIDNPNCSIAAPCRGFAAAILATNTGGEIVALDSAGYGAVNVDKSLTIIAPPGIHAAISVFAGFDGVLVNAPAADVVLRGLSINGQGGSNGVNVMQAARVRIENCVIAGMNARGISHTGDGTQLIVIDTILRDNQGAGIAMISANGSIVLDHVRIEHGASYGFFSSPTSGSISVSASIGNSVISGNALDGIALETVNGTRNDAEIDHSTIAHNAANGIRAFAPGVSSKVFFTVRRSTIHGNGADGVVAIATGGLVRGRLAENDIAANGSIGVHADTTGSRIDLTQNIVGPNFGTGVQCGPNGLIVTLQNNIFDSSASSNNCLFEGTGQ